MKFWCSTTGSAIPFSVIAMYAYSVTHLKAKIYFPANQAKNVLHNDWQYMWIWRWGNLRKQGVKTIFPKHAIDVWGENIMHNIEIYNDIIHRYYSKK